MNGFYKNKNINIPNPNRGNHIKIFNYAGLSVKNYRYLNILSNGFDIEGMLNDIVVNISYHNFIRMQRKNR